MAMMLAGIFMGTIVHAANGTASFSLLPVKFDPANPITKSYFVFNVGSSPDLNNSVRLINSGNVRGTVDLYPVDTTTNQYSGVAYFGRNAPRVDVASWIHLSIRRITLAPNQSQDIPFYLTIPRGVRSGQHVGGIVAENVNLQNIAAGKSKGLLTVTRDTIIPVVANLPGPHIESLVTTGIRFDGTNSFQRLLIGLYNTGNMLLKPVGSLVVTNQRGNVVQKNALNLDALLPQTSIQYPINIRKIALPVGIYRARLQLTYGKYTRRTINIASLFFIRRSGKPLMNVVVHAAPEQPISGIFSQLSLWQYLVGGALLLITGSAMLFWIQRFCGLVVSFQHKRRSQSS